MSTMSSLVIDRSALGKFGNGKPDIAAVVVGGSCLLDQYYVIVVFICLSFNNRYLQLDLARDFCRSVSRDSHEVSAMSRASVESTVTIDSAFVKHQAFHGSIPLVVLAHRAGMSDAQLYKNNQIIEHDQ